MSKYILAESAPGADWTSWASLVVAAFALGFTIYWSRRTERRMYLDEYWFRQVVAPKCVNPVIEFHDVWLLRIGSLTGTKIDLDEFQNLMGDLQAHKSSLENSVWITRIFSKTFFLECSKNLERVEDSFADELGNVLLKKSSLEAAQSALKASVGDAAVSILANAAKIHGNVKAP